MVRWGFLGAGWIARAALAPAVHAAAGAELAAVASRDPVRAGALGAERTYSGYAELLADPDIDAVYINLTNEAHHPWALAALGAGKHVLCEKPLALSAGQVAELTAAAADRGLRLVEASWYRWHPRTLRARELLAGGALGTVRHVAAGFTFALAHGENYRWDPARGGGAGYDVGCYLVSAALWAAGSAPSSVSARAVAGPTGVDLTMELAVTFASGAQAELRASLAEPERQWLRITGDTGTLEFAEPAFTAYREPCELVIRRGGRTERERFPACDAYRLMVEQVSRSIRADPGEPAVVSAAESRAGAAVLDAAFRSAAQAGAVVRPVESVTDD